MEAALVILAGWAFYSAALVIASFGWGVHWAAKKIKRGELKVSA